jgi:hypothetical protein
MQADRRQLVLPDTRATGEAIAARPGGNPSSYPVRVLTLREYRELERQLKRARAETSRQRARAELWRHRALERARK